MWKEAEAESRVVWWVHDKGSTQEYPPLSLTHTHIFFLCPSCVRQGRSIFHESRDLTHAVLLRMEIRYGGGCSDGGMTV